MSDLISRADAKKEVYLLGKNPSINEIWDCLDSLPSADRPTMIPIELEKRYPNSKDEDITDAFMRGYEYGIKSDRPSGEWTEKEVMVDEDTNITEWQSARCSVCGKYHTTPYMYYFDNFNYCPSCGARMENEK